MNRTRGLQILGEGNLVWKPMESFMYSTPVCVRALCLMRFVSHHGTTFLCS